MLPETPSKQYSQTCSPAILATILNKQTAVFSINISHCVFLGTRPACDSFYMTALIGGNHASVCTQVCGELIMMVQTQEDDQNRKHAIWCKRRINGKFMIALRQKVEIMAQLTDAAFAPLRHDQITVSFFSNGFSVSAPPPGAQRGRNHSYQQDCFYSLPQSCILLPLAWRPGEGEITLPAYTETRPPCALWDQQLLSQLGFFKPRSRLHSGNSVRSKDTPETF